MLPLAQEGPERQYFSLQHHLAEHFYLAELRCRLPEKASLDFASVVAVAGVAVASRAWFHTLGTRS
jgi:hypothetical protein